MSRINEAMSNEESERSKVVAGGAARVSVFGHPEWQLVLHECVETEDRQVWHEARPQEVDYISDSVAVMMVGQQFVGDILVQCMTVWSGHHIQVVQVDAVLAQLTVVHTCVRCIVDPKFYGDEAEEEVRAWMWWWCVALRANPCAC